MRYKKSVRTVVLILAISLSFTIGLGGCANNKSEAVTGVELGEAAESANNQTAELAELSGPAEDLIEVPSEENIEDTGLTAEKVEFIEDVFMKDAEAYLDALRREDAETLSVYMAPAENEYTVSDMSRVLEGFRLYYDNLQELQLEFQENEQDEEYYIKRFVIEGTKDGQGRSIPLVVKYAKSLSMDAIQNDLWRAPLFDSPLIGSYPYAILEPERYLQAIIQQDTESIALHLGWYVDRLH